MHCSSRIWWSGRWSTPILSMHTSRTSSYTVSSRGTSVFPVLFFPTSLTFYHHLTCTHTPEQSEHCVPDFISKLFDNSTNTVRFNRAHWCSRFTSGLLFFSFVSLQTIDVLGIHTYPNLAKRTSSPSLTPFAQMRFEKFRQFVGIYVHIQND